MIIDIEDWYRYYDVVFYGNYQVRVKVRREGSKNTPQTSLEGLGSIGITKSYKSMTKK